MKKILLIILFSVIFILQSCDKGIEPEPFDPNSGQTGFSGTVTFEGNWIQGVTRTHVVVFKELITKDDDFFPPNLSFVIDSIPFGSSSFTFNSIDNNFIPIFTLGPGDYKYVVVAQSKTPQISFLRKDWFVVGVYSNINDQSIPSILKIVQGRMMTNINILCDFDDPPPQPPGGE